MKKLKEIKVEASHKAQGVEGVLRGSKEGFQGRLGLYCGVCFVRRFPSGNLGLLRGGPE